MVTELQDEDNRFPVAQHSGGQQCKVLAAAAAVHNASLCVIIQCQPGRRKQRVIMLHSRNLYYSCYRQIT